MRTPRQQFIDANGIGTMSDDGLMHNFYENASGSEVLDLYPAPGIYSPFVFGSHPIPARLLSPWGSSNQKEDVH